MKQAPKNKIVILTAPSGAGKTSITKHLLHRFPELEFSVSATTRKARENEVDGRDYYFFSPEQFHQKIQENAFVEWEMVYEGKYYGTLKNELHRIWARERTPILDIDVKGAIHVEQQFPGNCLSIFIQPPSVAELKKRLESRGTETIESLSARVNKASYEISFSSHFGHTIVNDDLANACISAEKLVSQYLKDV